MVLNHQPNNRIHHFTFEICRRESVNCQQWVVPPIFDRQEARHSDEDSNKTGNLKMMPIPWKSKTIKQIVPENC